MKKALESDRLQFQQWRNVSDALKWFKKYKERIETLTEDGNYYSIAGCSIMVDEFIAKIQTKGLDQAHGTTL